MGMKLYLAAGPENGEDAAKTGLPLAVLGWRAEKSGRLLVRREPLCGGEILCADIREFAVPQNAAALAGALLSEMRERGMRGILLDSGGRENPAAKTLGRLLLPGMGNAPLYMTAANAPEGAFALAETAVTQGTLSAKLQHFSGRKTALDMQRLCREYLLPAKNENGRGLSREELGERLHRFRPAVHFSRELCAHYFTWSRGRETYFVLFDDGVSLRRKLHLASSMGIETAFLLWTEVRDIIGEFLPHGRSF